MSWQSVDEENIHRHEPERFIYFPSQNLGLDLFGVITDDDLDLQRLASTVTLPSTLFCCAVTQHMARSIEKQL